MSLQDHWSPLQPPPQEERHPAEPQNCWERAGLLGVAHDPLTQGRLICLCEAGRWFRDLPLTRVTSDSQAILALSMSVKMILGSLKGAIVMVSMNYHDLLQLKNL